MLDGRCSVLCACSCLTRPEVPDGLAQEASLGEEPIRGGSFIIPPLGRALAGSLSKGEPHV